MAASHNDSSINTARILVLVQYCATGKSTDIADPV